MRELSDASDFDIFLVPSRRLITRVAGPVISGSGCGKNNPSLKPWPRIESAGYGKEATGEEALATGPTPDAAFWGVFNDVDGHRLLVATGSTAVGSGKWTDKWVLTFGAAPRSQ